MKVLVISSRDVDKGSTRFRIAQYAPFLQSEGVTLDYVRRSELNAATVARLRDYDVLFNQKCLIRTGLARHLLGAARRSIFDFDDAIYTRPGRPYGPVTGWRVRRRLRQWLRGVDLVTTANGVLAEYARRHTGAVQTIPMAIDLELWRPAPRRDGPVVIGWAGAPVNLPLIERLDGVLQQVLQRGTGVELAVFSGQRPRLRCAYRYCPFVPGGEAEFMRGIDIGLLPLTDDAYARGKSPIKAIQYLACGVPVVGNVFGATSEILNDTNSIAVSSEAQWLAALEWLIGDADLRARLGDAGRRHAERQHDRERVARQLLEALRG